MLSFGFQDAGDSRPGPARSAISRCEHYGLDLRQCRELSSEAATSRADEAAGVKEIGTDEGETYGSVSEGMTSEGASTQEESTSDFVDYRYAELA